MAAESKSSPAPAFDKSLVPAPSNVENQIDGPDTKGEVTEASGKSVFVNSEPMREEQVQNAIKFLSHPKVRGSPVIYRRSFLVNKGLTKEEIDEAFRRVPDSAPNVTSGPAGNLNRDASSQPQVPTQALQPASIPSITASSNPTLSQSRFHWSNAFLAAGLLSAFGAGTIVLLKTAIVPSFKSWILNVVSEGDASKKKEDAKPTLAEEATAAAKAAAVAAADLARTSHELLKSKNEEMKCFETLATLLNAQVEEMKSMSKALQKMEGTKEVTHFSKNHAEDYVHYPSGANNNVPSKGSFSHELGSISSMDTKQVKVNGAMDNEMGSAVRPSSAFSSTESSMGYPKSYMEILDKIQRGEKPPGIMDINDKPPNPSQSPSHSRLAPKVKPWDAGNVLHGSNNRFPTDIAEEGLSAKAPNNGYELMNQRSDDSKEGRSDPSWRPKGVKIVEIEPKSFDQVVVSQGITEDNSLPVQRRWIPPQPPTVANPEAAAAIRQPNPPIQKMKVASEAKVEVKHPSNMAEQDPSERQEDRDEIVELNGDDKPIQEQLGMEQQRQAEEVDEMQKTMVASEAKVEVKHPAAWQEPDPSERQ